MLSERGADGSGIAWLVRFMPREDKAIRIAAVAPSDEHIFNRHG